MPWEGWLDTATVTIPLKECESERSNGLPAASGSWLVGSCLCALAVLLTVLPTPSVGPVFPLVLPLLLLIRLLPMALAVPWVLGISAVLWFLLGQTPVVWFVLLLCCRGCCRSGFVRRDNFLMDLTAALALSVGALLLIHFQVFGCCRAWGCAGVCPWRDGVIAAELSSLARQLATGYITDLK